MDITDTERHMNMTLCALLVNRQHEITMACRDGATANQIDGSIMI